MNKIDELLKSDEFKERGYEFDVNEIKVYKQHLTYLNTHYVNGLIQHAKITKISPIGFLNKAQEKLESIKDYDKIELPKDVRMKLFFLSHQLQLIKIRLKKINNKAEDSSL